MKQETNSLRQRIESQDTELEKLRTDKLRLQRRLAGSGKERIANIIYPQSGLPTILLEGPWGASDFTRLSRSFANALRLKVIEDHKSKLRDTVPRVVNTDDMEADVINSNETDENKEQLNNGD